MPISSRQCLMHVTRGMYAPLCRCASRYTPHIACRASTRAFDSQPESVSTSIELVSSVQCLQAVAPTTTCKRQGVTYPRLKLTR